MSVSRRASLVRDPVHAPAMRAAYIPRVPEAVLRCSACRAPWRPCARPGARSRRCRSTRGTP
eukprot:6199754-Pleurochrysis_carterae.AAC.3